MQMLQEIGCRIAPNLENFPQTYEESQFNTPWFYELFILSAYETHKNKNKGDFMCSCILYNHDFRKKKG